MKKKEVSMRYKDALYGEWDLPDFIEELIHTKEMVRLRRITQAVIPNSLIYNGPIPSRFQHCLGVCRLAMIVLENNPSLNEYKTILPVAALLHDAGNPALSHLGERFLRELTGKDGESFLENILENSETGRLLVKFGLPISQIVALVTGKFKPISEVLNGSIDIDNLDNVGRYDLAARLGAEKFNAFQIAESFRFQGDKWVLLGECYEESKKWKNARAVVYDSIYKKPHLTAATMVCRAIELAFCQNKIPIEFFLLNDDEAIEFLLTRCGPRAAYIINKALRWEWYEEIISVELNNPSNKTKIIASDWRGRKELADKIAHKLDIPEEKIAVIVSKGKGKRKITLPFIFTDGGCKYDESNNNPVYMVKVYVSRELFDKSVFIERIIREELM